MSRKLHFVVVILLPLPSKIRKLSARYLPQRCCGQYNGGSTEERYLRCAAHTG